MVDIFSGNQLENDVLEYEYDNLNFDNFYLSLDTSERDYLSQVEYPSSYSFKNATSGDLYIYQDGTLSASEIILDTSLLHKYFILGRKLDITEDFDTLNLLQAKILMQEYGMEDDAKGIQKIIDEYQNDIQAKERILDTVMYRLIERGGFWLGVHRAYLFALEFERNLDIPMIYGFDMTDMDLNNFINTYLQNGGKEDLECFVNYFDKNGSCGTIVLKDYLNLQTNEDEKVRTK